MSQAWRAPWPPKFRLNTLNTILLAYSWKHQDTSDTRFIIPENNLSNTFLKRSKICNCLYSTIHSGHRLPASNAIQVLVCFLAKTRNVYLLSFLHSLTQKSSELVFCVFPKHLWHLGFQSNNHKITRHSNSSEKKNINEITL